VVDPTGARALLLGDTGPGSGLSRRGFVTGLMRSGLLLGTGGGLLAACGSSDSSSSAPSASGAPSGTVALVHEGAADLAPIIEGVIKNFEKAHPGIDVKNSVLGGGGTAGGWAQYSDALTTQIAGGKVPDVVWMATEGLRLFASKGLLEPLDEYITRDEAELSAYFDSLPSGMLDRWDKLVAPDGKRYQLPSQFNTMGIWYNADLFKQAGVPEPKDDWTWEDFHAAAEKLTVPGKVFGMHAVSSYFVGVLPWLLTNGASSLNEDWTQATINTPEAIEAATFMRQLVEERISPKPGGQFDPIAAMAQGKLAMFGGGWWPLFPARAQGLLKKVKIAPWPQQKGNGSPVGWNMYPIFKASKNKPAAWEFVKYMTDPKVSDFISARGVTLPLSKEVAAKALKQGPPGAHHLYDALDYATPVPSPDNNAIIQKSIEDAFGQILAGNVSPADGLGKLNGEIQANL
jgi:multiple sugar transport system substrate-binding protein